MRNILHLISNIRMKTNQIMTRDDGFVQRTKDGYFNATALLKAYNSTAKEEKQLAKYKLNKSAKEFIRQLENEGISSPMISGRGSGGVSGTWMHPKLFIDFAMWVSVEFKSRVIDYVLDGLIMSRHDAGDYYNEMCATIITTYIEIFGRKPDATIYINEARRIKAMLGLEDKDRNTMTEKELDNVTQMQKLNSILIENRVSKPKRIGQLEMLASALNLKKRKSGYYHENGSRN